MPNKAFREHTWTNDKKHSWKQWRYGHSSLAVDGNADANLPNCAIMDNYYVDNPVWMVDLGRSADVNGVVVLTWQGSGQGRLYANYWVTHLIGENLLLTRFRQFRQLVGRYCSYLLPRQYGGTSQI